MFIGQTRFSLYVPNSTAWRASSGGSQAQANDKYKSFLYDDERLRLRTDVFLEHTIPTLQLAAEKYDVVHIVSFSESLPSKYKQLLHEAAEKYPVMLLDEVPDGDNAWGSTIRVAKEKGVTGVLGRYRLDDDDVLSTEYFDLVSPYVKPEFVGMMVSLPLGIEAIRSGSDFYNLREAHVPMNSMGLLSVCSIDSNGTVRAPQGGAHDKSDRFAPVIIDSRGLGYLRCLHDGQDNAMRYREDAVMESLLDGMAKFPAFTDGAQLTQSFPTISKAMGAQSDHRIEVNQKIEDGIFLELGEPTSGISLQIRGECDEPIASKITVSFVFVDKAGHRVPAYKVIEGIAASKNPNIGHFVYLDSVGKTIDSLISVYVAHGYAVKWIGIRGLNDQAKLAVISEIRLRSTVDGISRVDPETYQDRFERLSVSGGARFVEAVYGKRGEIAGLVKKTLGNERGSNAVSILAKWRKRLRS